MHSKRGRQAWSTIGMLAAFTISACSRGDRPEMGTVTGVVRREGKPLPNAEITFMPEKGRASYGRTDAEGKYELEYIGSAKGAILGHHAIAVEGAGLTGKVTGQPAEADVKPGVNVIDIDVPASTKR